MKRYFSAPIVLVCVLAVFSCLVTAGCSSIQSPEDKPGDPRVLEERVRDFHTAMRWSLFEDAADLTHDAYRYSFEGEYEERGEDFRITELTVRRVEFLEDGFAAHVEVEQEWYQLPSTTMQRERFMERWVWEDDDWLLRERILRDVYREQDRRFDSEPDDDEEEDADDDAVADES